MSKAITEAMVEAARSAASRLIAGAFRRDGERLEDEKRPRFSIPTRPDYDDDVTLMDFIASVSAALSAPLPEGDKGEAPVDLRHEFIPNKKYPWFCAHCGYAPHEPLKHVQPAEGVNP